jgi:hypothetical protein
MSRHFRLAMTKLAWNRSYAACVGAPAEQALPTLSRNMSGRAGSVRIDIVRLSPDLPFRAAEI